MRGYTDDDRWATSPAKAYPSTLSRILAESFVHAIHSTWPWLSTSEQRDVCTHSALYQPLDHYLDAHMQRGADTFHSPWLLTNARSSTWRSTCARTPSVANKKTLE